MPLLGFANAGKAVAVLWDDEEVGGGNGSDVSKCQTLVILIDDVGRDLLPHNLVEDGIFLGLRILCPLLLSSFGHLNSFDLRILISRKRWLRTRTEIKCDN